MKVIAINVSFLSKPVLESTDTFILNVLRQLITDNTSVRFILINKEAYIPGLVLPENSRVVLSYQASGNKIQQYWWHRFTLPRILKKYNVNLYLSLNGQLSLFTTIPQYLLISNIGYLQMPSLFTAKQVSYGNKTLPVYLKKAAGAITLSNSEKALLQNQYPYLKTPINVIAPYVHHSFVPLTYPQRKEVKEKYTDGYEYFFYTGPCEEYSNIVGLLKAFSKFKKRQQSNWKLVLALPSEPAAFTTKVNSYKYKADVVVLSGINTEEMACLTAAAYAFIAPVFYEGAGINLLQAMQCNVPVITSTHTPFYTLAPDAAIYLHPENIDAIAQQLMLLYKDENLCKKLALNGNRFAQTYQNHAAAQLLWQTMVQ